MFGKNGSIRICDPAVYLKQSAPGQQIKLLRSACIDEDKVPAYLIRDLNGCAVNAAACLVAFSAHGGSVPPGEDGRSFGPALALCKKIAADGFSKMRDGTRDYYTKIGREAPFVRRCLGAASSGYSARSSLLVKRRAVSEILAGRPVLLNIAFSGQYTDHTVTAYGFEEYAVGDNGRKVLFFKIRDGYSKEPRYLEYKGILGISITYLKQK